jgi:hypothetical protein
MSVTICWLPQPGTGKHFSGGRSASLERLTKVFGGVITEPQVPVLRAMAIASGDEFYNEVADVVETAGAIKFWGEWCGGCM